MRRRYLLAMVPAWWVWAMAQHAALAQDTPTPWTFQLKDGDRVALIGNALIEREQRFGYVELALTTHYPDRHVVFRNMGWSGDTVYGEARSYFGPPAEGFDHLVRYMRDMKPTVILFCYGSNEAHHGAEGLSGFIGQYEKLLTLADQTGAKVALLSPIAQQKLPPPLPDPAKQNERLSAYTLAIGDLAKRRGYAFADLFNYLDAAASPPDAPPLSHDGVHLNAYGYWRVADVVMERFGLEQTQAAIELAAGQSDAKAVGAKTAGIRSTAEGLSMTVTLDRLPLAASPGYESTGPVLRITGLKEGRYTLTIDDKPVATADAAGWAAGQTIAAGPDAEQVELLRKTIIWKNELFFHGYRPQNETYLRGFRKHEQGNNAVEIPQFEPLVVEQEKRIAQLRQPVPHVWKLTPQKEGVR